MTIAMWWAVLAGVLVACELASTTFYLLMLAVGAGAGAGAAWLGLGFEAQLVIASLVGAVGVLALRKSRQGKAANTPGNNDLDVGNMVDVHQWDSTGTCRVDYRGAPWSADAVYPDPQAGPHRIVAIQANRLKLQKL